MIHLIKLVVPPPTDRRVLLLLDGVSPEGIWVHGLAATAPHARAWCEPPTLTEPSGPVHSLEAGELPLIGKEVLVTDRQDREHVAHRGRSDAYWVKTPYGDTQEVLDPKSWRPLPDDEPGDAEDALDKVVSERTKR